MSSYGKLSPCPCGLPAATANSWHPNPRVPRVYYVRCSSAPVDPCAMSKQAKGNTPEVAAKRWNQSVARKEDDTPCD